MIILVRHGLAAQGVEDLDPGLSVVGHEQARITAEALRGVHSARLVVSPLRRTQETAAPIASLLGMTPELRNEVAEVFDPSMPVEERRNMIGPFMRGLWSEQSEGLNAWRQRAIDALTQVGSEAATSGHDVIVATHYVFISTIIGAATGDDRVIPTPIANCSMTRLEYRDGRLVLVEAGDASHLPPELQTGAGQALAGRG